MTQTSRSFFNDQKIDQKISQLSLKYNVGVGMLYTLLAQTGMRVYLHIPLLLKTLNIPEGLESNEHVDDNNVLRNISLEVDYDNFLRQISFDMKCSKDSLLRHFISKGLKILE